MVAGFLSPLGYLDIPLAQASIAAAEQAGKIGAIAVCCYNLAISGLPKP
jgi:hypothetical protein